MEASEVEHIWREPYVSKSSNGQFDQHGDEDFGPETDVDGIHDVLTSGFTADTAKAKSLVVQSQAIEEWLPSKFEPSQQEFLKTLPWTYADALKKPKPEITKRPEQQKDIIITEVPSIIGEPVECNKSNEDPKRTAATDEIKNNSSVPAKSAASPDAIKKTEEIGNDVVEAEVEDGSEDDSEDEWNYVSGKNSKRPERKSQVEAFGTPEGRRQDKDEIDDEDDMSRLNPDAAPFVPVFEEDKVLASSPSKGAEISLEDVQVPMVEAFLADISAKPSELESIEYDGCVNEQSINGIDNSDSTNAECGNDIVGQDCKTNDDPAVHSSNPFAVDNIHTQMVSDYFGEHLDLGFKPFDPMQESMIVLESTPSPSAPTGELCDFGQNDKPDLLSPVDNIVDQQTPSSGFESEPADDLDKCDLVAGIFQDRAQHDMVDVENVTIDKSEDTNPFTSTTASDFTSAATQQENSSELHADEYAHVLDVVQEEKPSEDVDQISPSNLDHVDLIPGITTDSSFEPHAVAPQVNVDLISPDVALHGQAGIVLHEEEANGTKDDVVPCNDVKEMDLLGVDERAKEDAGDSDGFEIISHEEAEIGHQTMNGIHPNDDYPDNYKMNDLVEHSVQIHQAPKTDEDLTPAVRNDDIFGYEYRQELNESECGNVESLKDFQKNHFDDSPAQELNVLDTDQPEVRQEAFENVFSKSSISSTGADIEPKVEEIISQVEELALEDRIPPVESTDEVLTKSEPEPVQSEPTEGSHDLSPEVPETEVIQTQIITPEPVLTDEVLMVPSELAEKQAVEQANPLDLPTPDNLLVSPVDLSEGISEDMSGDVHVDNEPGKQNGLVADVATPPSTPAPGIEKEDSQDCLIAAAVAAAGAATVTAAAAAVASVAETKVEERPAVTKAAAKPTASKTAAKPATAVSAAKKPTTAKAPVSAAKAAPGKPTAPVKTVAAKPTAPKPASPVSKTATSTTAKPKPALSAASKPAAPKPAGLTAKPATTAAKPAVAAAKAPIAKPKMPTSTTAPVKKPTTTASTRPPTATTVAKKPEPAKPLAKAPARPTATTTARPTTATKPASATSTARPTSATKPAAKPLPAARTTAVKTTTTAPKPAAPRVPATATKAPAKPTTPVSKTAPAAKAPPKPRPAAPTVLKKAAPAAADKNKPPTKPAPIRKPADKTKPVDKDQTEPPMQEPIVSTTNGHIENGILSNDSPLIASRPIVEALN